MVFIPRWERYRTRKPTGAVEINWNNALTDGLVTALLPDGYDLIDITTNQAIFGTIRDSSQLIKYGDAVKSASSTSHYSFPVKSEQARSLTIAHACRVDVSATNILLRDHTNTGGYIFGWMNGGWDMRVGGVDFNSAGTFSVGIEYLYVVTAGPASTQLFVDGSKIISGGAGGTDNPNSTWYVHKNGAVSQYARASTGFIFVWDTDKSDFEIKAFYEAPYQILKPRVTYVDMGAASAYQAATLKLGNGTGFVTPAVKVWNGTGWDVSTVKVQS